MKNEKAIAEQTHLQARGLFVLAHAYMKKAKAAEVALGELLRYDDSYLGCISDEIYEGGDFDSGMKKEGFTIKPPKAKRGRR